MYFAVESHQYQKYEHLLDQMFRLRARVFHDELGWKVEKVNGRETDAYDNLKPVYLLWTDPSGRVLLGSLRLMPTTGPTLLHDVFRHTFPSDVSLSAPGIWEGTRLCINAMAIAKIHPEIDQKTAFCRMLLALCELGVLHGIHTLVSNYEPPTRRLYQMAGAPLHYLGQADGFGKRPVCAGSFEVSHSVLEHMRKTLSVAKPLLCSPLQSPSPTGQSYQFAA